MDFAIFLVDVTIIANYLLENLLLAFVVNLTTKLNTYNNPSLIVVLFLCLNSLFKNKFKLEI